MTREPGGTDGSETPNGSEGPNGSETPNASEGPNGSETPNASEGYPSVPHERLLAGGWRLRSTSEETVFRMPAVAVVGSTLFYDDVRLYEAIEAGGAGGAGGAEGPPPRSDGDGGLIAVEEEDTWRFFFATRLSFRPPLAPGIGPASLRPTVASRARRTFAEDLESRGFEGVESGRKQRLRTESGDRARLRKFTADLPLTGGTALPDCIDVEGWLAVWAADGSFRIAGGAYPVTGLEALLGSGPESDAPPAEPGAFREELLGLIRSVR